MPYVSCHANSSQLLTLDSGPWFASRQLPPLFVYCCMPKGRGPASWRNWRAKGPTKPHKTWEFACYSDAAGVAADVLEGLGPYELLNPVPVRSDSHDRSVRMVVVVRAEGHIPREASPGHTGSADWHGGTLPEELAALLSLFLGIRLRTGGVVREFNESGDRRGMPVEWDHRPPYLPAPSGAMLIVPQVMGNPLPDLRDSVRFLSKLPGVRADDATALVRAARAYQEAVWGIEADPNQGWIRLIGAIEAAAERWDSRTESAAEQFEVNVPRLAHWLLEHAPDGFELAAVELFNRLGSTSRFLRFVLEHLPAAPPDRPSHGVVKWEDLDESLRQIYGYRSKALHGGTPFPAPMCWPPMERPYEERPGGLGAGTQDHMWDAAELPMLLHVFAYITRGCLLNWWERVPLETSEGGPA